MMEPIPNRFQNRFQNRAGSRFGTRSGTTDQNQNQNQTVVTAVCGVSGQDSIHLTVTYGFMDDRYAADFGGTR